MVLEPSAPPFEGDLVDYNCEAGCDVVFLVGSYPENVIRIPVHSHKLMGCPIFKAMLSEMFVGMREEYDRGEGRMIQIPVPDIDGKAFDNMMKFVYKKPLNLHMQTPEMVIETLKAAHKYLLPGLVWMCVKHTSTFISQNNVIWIYANVRYLCNDLDNLEELTKSEAHRPMPTRPQNAFLVCPEGEEHDHLSVGFEIKRLCVWLLGQTLNFIDAYAGLVLQSDELEQLDRPFLEFLLKRDSLSVSEVVVFSALVRWAESECKRRHLTLTSQSKRRVLHDLIYLVRFFQMTLLEYRSAEYSGLLTAEEDQVIKSMIVFGHPGSLRNLKAHPQLHGMLVHWGEMCQARVPRLTKNKDGNDAGTGGAGKKRKRSSVKESGGKRKNSFKKVGGLVKNYCLPCTDNNDKRRHTEPQITHGGNPNQSLPSHQDNNFSSYSNANHQDTPRDVIESGRRKSTFSKAFYYTVTIFAFFFD